MINSKICILCCCILLFYTNITIAQNTIETILPKIYPHIEFSDIMMDDKIDNIEYILIENQSIIESRILGLFLTDDYIFIEQDDEILQFNREGKYICSINHAERKSFEYFIIKKDKNVCSGANFAPNNRMQLRFNEKNEFNSKERESLFNMAEANIKKINQAFLLSYYNQIGKCMSAEALYLLNDIEGVSDIHMTRINLNNGYIWKLVQSDELKRQLKESKNISLYLERQKTLKEFVTRLNNENNAVLMLVKLKL